MDDARAAELVQVVEHRLAQVEGLTDPVAREAAQELVRALLELYGEGLARLAALATGAGGERARVRMVEDELLAHLFILHDLHPRSVDARIGQALAALGGTAPELVDVAGSRARLRLPATGGCGSGQLRAAAEEAVRAAAPEITEVEFEQAPPPPVLIPLASVRSGP